MAKSTGPVKITRTKTSIRYAKENDKEKRERRKEREKMVFFVPFMRLFCPVH